MHNGHHIILDLYHCSDTAIRNEELILQAFQQAIKLSQVTALNIIHHKFSPHGITAVALLAESHMSIHTWPEHGYAAIDIYTCGDNLNSESALNHLASVLEPQTYRTRRLERPIGPTHHQQEFADGIQLESTSTDRLPSHDKHCDHLPAEMSATTARSIHPH